MADNTRRPKIRYDDFVANVQADPANPQATIMLAGYLGHGPEGQVRIYPDPSLGTWYDVAQDAIVHTTPISDAPLGGSYVWVKSSAEIKPGTAAAQPAAPAAGAAQAAAAAPALQPTPATHCFICPPMTALCGGAGVAAGGMPATLVCLGAVHPTPTPQTHCFICPPHHPQTHFLCTQGLATFCGCTPGIDCNQPPGGIQTRAPVCTQGFPTFCGCTPGIACGGLQAAAAPAAPFSPLTICFGGAGCGPQAAAAPAAPFSPLTICFGGAGCGPQAAAAPAAVFSPLTICFGGAGCPPGRAGVFTPFGG